MPSDFLIRVGIPKPNGAFVKHALAEKIPVMLSANSLWDPKGKRFREPSFKLWELDLALDSAGFVAMKTWGDYPWKLNEYASLAAWLRPRWWASMDLCCEKEIANSPKIVEERRVGTAALFLELLCIVDRWRQRGVLGIENLPDPMPVLQGWEADDYARSVRMTGYWLRRMERPWPALVGVGSVCRRSLSGPAGVAAILDAVHDALNEEGATSRLHFFGAKSDAIELLSSHPRPLSCDSMAWDSGAREDIRDQRLETGNMDLPCSNEHRLAHLERWRADQQDRVQEGVREQLRLPGITS